MALRKKGDAQRQAAGRKVKCEGEMEKVGEEQRKKTFSEKTSKETRKGREAGRKMTGEGGEEHKRECSGGENSVEMQMKKRRRLDRFSWRLFSRD